MSRTKRGTTPQFRDKYPGGEVVADLAKQNMTLRKELEFAVGQVNVTRTLLAAVLSSRPDLTVRVSKRQIEELEGRAFTIEKRVTEDGGLEIRAEIKDVVDAEVLDAENEGMPPNER